MVRWTRRRRHAEDVLARTKDGYDGALADGGVVLFQQTAPGIDGHHVSASMARVLGWDPLAFTTPGTLRNLVHPDDLHLFRAVVPSDAPLVPPPVPTELLVAELRAPALPESSPQVSVDGHGLPDGLSSDPRAAEGEPVVRMLAADRSWRHMLVRLHAAPTATPAPAPGPETVGGMFIDVSADAVARTDQRRFAQVVERSPAGCLVLEFTDASDPTTLLVRSANGSARRLFKLERAGVDGVPLSAVFGEASAQLIRSALFDVAHTGESLTAERLTFAEVPGTYLDMRVDRLPDGTLGVTVLDVTHNVAVEERLRHQASHDTLTGLPNRALLEERIAGATARLGSNECVALMLVEIDDLRSLNDGRGHQFGDQVLVELGRRLARDIRGCELVARIGGDEFAVLTLPTITTEEALERADSVRRALERPVEVGGELVQCRSAVGVAVAPAHGEDARTLMRSADAALSRARRGELPLAVHDLVDERSSIRRLGLLNQLRQGLANRELELRYQPVVDLRTGRVTKVEALLRWQRADDGARLPVEFLELAEQSGLIQPLTRWILGEAARTAGELARPDRPMVVTTNLTMRNLYDSELVSFLELLLRSGELSPQLVEVEIGENELMDDPVRAQEVVARLAGLGLSVVVDDFGTGYTSLSTMSNLAVSGLKIDRSFIATLSSVANDAAVVHSTIELSHQLGLAVTAEGVADAATLARLAEFGCDFAQGFHLSEPVTLEVLPRRIAELEEALAGWLGTAGRGASSAADRLIGDIVLD